MTDVSSKTPKSSLVFRLSSLGDLILSLSALSSMADDRKVEWVVAEEYAELIQGHPAIARVWPFAKRRGLVAWLELCRDLRTNSWAEILDLHCTLRTRIARLVFLLGAEDARWSAISRWKTLPKQRIRLFGFYFFKRLWPKRLRPTPFVQRHSMLASGQPEGRADLRYLLQGARRIEDIAPELQGRDYICVMPSSRWPGKEWGVGKYADFLQKKALFPVVLGTSGDGPSRKLVEVLSARGINHVCGIGRWDWKTLAKVVSGARAYLGGDTGLGHLAEALGVPAWMIFGPTHPEMGFGPWRKGSVAIGSALWCRPCGKDGRNCFRLRNRYECLSALTPDEVERQILAAAVRST